MKVYTDPGNFQSLKLFIAANKCSSCDKKLKVEYVESKHSERVIPYMSKSKLPVLEVFPGKFLFSANTAAKYFYLNTVGLVDEDHENKFLEWESSELLPVVASYLVSTVGHGKKDKVLEAGVSTVLKQLETKLAKSKYLSGTSLGLSDVCVFSTVFPLLDLKNFDLFNNLPKTKQWSSSIREDPAVQAAITRAMGENGQEAMKASLLGQSFSSPPGGKVSASNTPKTSTSSVPAEEHVEEKVPQEELDAAVKAWATDLKNCPRPRVRCHPVLPQADERNLLVTSALPYVNNVPHLGNIIGCVLSADVFARFARLRNHNVLYICGTDEYGTATETKAMEEGVTPQEICDKYNKLHTQIYRWFNIEFDHFGRTTTQQQTEIAQDIFWKLYNEGYIMKDSVDQLQCTKCDKFLADRFVEGTCPLCGFDDARGDQCDSCGKLINAVELKEPKCKMCKSSPVMRTSQHLFVDLPKLEPKLKAHLDSVYASGIWTNNAKVITNSWIRDGLKPRCISRDLKWGTPVPLEGYTDKVFYVWFDAPIGYISITANYTDKWREWWKNPNKVEMYNFLGKDNVPFHSVIFPSCLLGANDGYSVVSHMVATEYLNYEDTKFSKSRGSGVFGDQAQETGVPADIYRFYLLYLRPESQDTSFCWDDFLLKNNSELLNNLGNFINRALMFLNNTFGGVIQEMALTEEDARLLALISRELNTFIENLEACRLRDGIRNILTISRLGNQYMQSNKPWVLAKGSNEDKARAGCVVSVSSNVSCLLSVLLQPYMPDTSATIQRQLAAPPSVNVISGQFVAQLRPGHKIGQPSPLFQKIEASLISNLKARFAGTPAEAAPAKKSPSKGKPQMNGTKASQEHIDQLTKAVNDQGNKVRQLKSAKAEKSVIDAEVARLLQLKAELASAQGGEPEAAAGGKKKKGGKGGNAPTGGDNAKAATPAVNSAEVERLTQAVADQGTKVRELKAAKADKSTIDAQVAVLLQLKKDLASSQGLDPEAAVGGGGKKKGKK